MKLQITHMKAPWPSGAKVGDVLELPAVPAWAAGKCRQVGNDVAATASGAADAVAASADQLDAAIAEISTDIESKPKAKK